MFRKICSIEWSKSTSCSIRGLQNELEGSKEGLAKQPGYCGDYSIKDTDLIAFKDVETQQSEEHSIISAAALQNTAAFFAYTIGSILQRGAATVSLVR